ncbi:unnamed protein product, partial [Heterosigma akashiwo]
MNSSLVLLFFAAALLSHSCSAFVTKAQPHVTPRNARNKMLHMKADFALLFDCDGVIVE